MPDPISFTGGPPLAVPARIAEIRSRFGRVQSTGDGATFDALLARAGGVGGTLGTESLGPAVLGGHLRTGDELGSTTTANPPPTAAGQAVVTAAMEYLGVPYLWGGTDPETGFDCSGLIQHAYRDIGIEIPKWSRHQATIGVEVPSLAEAQPGDIIAFGEPVNHVGLYIGDGQMLHAPRTGDVVKIETVDRPIATIRRVIGTPSAGPSVAGPSLTIPSATTTTDAPAAVATDRGPALDSPGAAPYRSLFVDAGSRWGVDPALLAAIAQTESAFDPGAVSPVGAQGLMQFMPATAAEMGVDPWDPASAIDGAARYLRISLDQFGSDDLAIASYNAGRGAVTRHGGIPPFPETQRYVQKVLDAWKGYA